MTGTTILLWALAVIPLYIMSGAMVIGLMVRFGDYFGEFGPAKDTYGVAVFAWPLVLLAVFLVNLFSGQKD